MGASALLAGMIVATSLLIGELAVLPTQSGIKVVRASRQHCQPKVGLGKKMAGARVGS